MNIRYDKELIDRFDSILARGLCVGVGRREGQMCIEAAICAALGLPHGDDPECVARAVRSYKIDLNDSKHWVTPHSRAEGLRDLGLAQIGSEGVVNDSEFSRWMAEKTIRVLLPKLYRSLFPNNKKLRKVADRCEREGTASADAAAWAAASDDSESYLRLSAELALDTLRELGSPGVKLLELRR